MWRVDNHEQVGEPLSDKPAGFARCPSADVIFLRPARTTARSSSGNNDRRANPHSGGGGPRVSVCPQPGRSLVGGRRQFHPITLRDLRGETSSPLCCPNTNSAAGRVAVSPMAGPLGPAAAARWRRSPAQPGALGACPGGDMETQEQLGPPLVGHTGAVRALTFGADSKTLATGSDDRNHHPVDVTTAAVGSRSRHSSSLWSLAFSARAHARSQVVRSIDRGLDVTSRAPLPAATRHTARCAASRSALTGNAGLM